MTDLKSRAFLLALLSNSDRWSIFTELAGKTENERSPILRPHDEAAFHGRHEDKAMAMRDRLDEALDDLTLIEIGFQTGLLDENTSSDPAFHRGTLEDFKTLVLASESFYSYCTAYLYFGVRILAWRFYGPCWPERIASTQRSDGSTNRRSFPIKDPPPLVLPADKTFREDEKPVPLMPLAKEPAQTPADLAAAAIQNDHADALFAKAIHNQRINPHWKEAMAFLDGYQPEDYGHNKDDKDSAIPRPAGASLYQEPADYELWLRGLLPDVDTHVRERFERISDGLTAWAHERTEFYLGRMQSIRFKAANMTWAKPGEADERNTVLKSPLTARFALADIYWLARLLRAQVTSHASVSYGHNTWLSLLAFRADLDGRTEQYRKTLKENERKLRLVFSFSCDLAQNCAAIAELTEHRHYNPWRYLDPGRIDFDKKPTKEWRAVFDEELREIDQQRSIRTYTDPSFIKDEPFPWNSNNPDRYFSERLITGRQPYNRIGLAFSGGGIRSATFNLGVLQGLQELNMLRHVDYLSTVSGGGFIGGWLAGNVARTRQWLTKGIRWDESINHLRSYASYLAPLTGILSADTWTLGASWARNTFLIQLTGVTWLVALLLIPLLGRKVFRVMERSYPASMLSVPHAGWLHMPWVGLVALVFGIVAAINLARNFRKNRVETGANVPRSGSILKWAVGPCWAGAFVVAALLCSVAREWHALPPVCLPITSPVVTCGKLSCTEVAGMSQLPKAMYEYGFMLQWAWQRIGILLLVHWFALLFIGAFALQPAEGAGGALGATRLGRGVLTAWRSVWIGALCSAVLYISLCGVLALDLRWVQPAQRFVSHAFVFGPSLVLAVFSLSVVFFIGLSGRTSSEAQREWWTRFGAWLLIFALLGLAASSAAVLSPIVVFKLWVITQNSLKYVRWAAILGWLGSVLGGVLAGKSSKTAGDEWSGKLQVLARAGGLMFVLGAIVVTATVLYHVLWSVAQGDNRVTDYWTSLDSIGYQTILGVLAVVCSCGWLFSRFFEINIFGLSQLYRNRLVRCYLGASRWAAGVRKPHPFTRFDFRDDIPLSDLRNEARQGKAEEKRFRGPFPIFNCTLNLGGSSDLAVHSRHSASFSLTPLRCGSDRPRIGYAPTCDRHAGASFAGGVKLGQAIAISGAAASPNMGYNTSPLVALLLTMFNVRLGWWFPNPGREAWAARGLSSSLPYLGRELLGTANEKQDFLNISDGGHFENLGVYELIRRRCKVIIASDAECDELLQFGGLGNLVRICATDFGAEIDLDVRSIAEQKNGHSLAHSAIGKIKYSNGTIGYLIYLKASMTGDEAIGVTQYRSQHPSFPHETTADQFYSESQFESYRLLGQHVVEWAFRGVPAGEDPLSAAEKLEDVMVAARTSGAAYLKHTRALDRLWEQFRQTPSLHSFLDELMRILPPVAVVPPSGNLHQHTEELAVALQLMQLMEDVFMDLQLDDFWEHPDNRGWALLFMRWARSVKFRNYWNQTHRTLGIRFEYFCAARLGLKRDVPIVRM